MIIYDTHQEKEWVIFYLCLNETIFFLQNDLHSERKSKIKYIQQFSNGYFVTKKGNVKTVVNKITKQNNLK